MDILFILKNFNNFLLIDATDRSKISSDQKRFFIALSLYPLSFFANTPFNLIFKMSSSVPPHYLYDGTLFLQFVDFFLKFWSFGKLSTPLQTI